MNKITRFVVLTLISISSIALGSDSDTKWETMVSDGETLLHANKPQKAIENYFNPVIEHFNSLNSTNSSQIYCARDTKETLVYLMQAAVMHEKKNEKNAPEFWGSQFADKKDRAEVLPQFWAKAFSLKATH